MRSKPRLMSASSLSMRTTRLTCRSPAAPASSRSTVRRRLLARIPLCFCRLSAARWIRSRKNTLETFASSLCNFLSDFTACFGSSACMSVGAGLNLSDTDVRRFARQRCSSRIGSERGPIQGSRCVLFTLGTMLLRIGCPMRDSNPTQGMSDVDAVFSQATDGFWEFSFPNFSQWLRSQA
jgi:hypothetical protein